MHFTGRGRTLSRLKIPLLPIARGVHIEEAFVLALDTPWARRRAVEIARLIAVSHLRASSVAVGRSALLAHGLDLLEPLPDETPGAIVFSGGRGSSRGALSLPAVILDGCLLAPRTRVRFVDAAHARTPPKRVHGLLAQDAGAAAVSCALLHPPRLAFALACQAYRGCLDLVEGERPLLETTELLRERALSALSALPAVRGGRRAARILAAADPGCESPAESLLLWNLLEAGVRGIRTQVHVCTAGRHFFVDMAIPELRLAIEFDGRGKYGDSPARMHRALEEERRRERLLVAAGWTVVRFDWADLKAPEMMAAEILSIIEARLSALAAGAQVGR